MAELEQLAEAISGRVVRRDDPDFDRERKLYNANFDGVRPAAIVLPAEPGDVSRVVTFARERELTVVARNGRHSFAGYSTAENALVVDVSELAAVEVDAERRVGRLGAGATLLPTYRALSPYKLALPGGTCPTVGVTGLTLVGGFGVLGRLHGLTCDSLLEADLVNADGELLHVDEDENPELFWAVRGGGGGSFGIVVSLTFRLCPADMRFTHAAVEFPWESAGRVFAVWQDWAHAAPPELWSALVLETQAPAAGPGALVEAVYGGDPRELDPILDELFAAVAAEPVRITQSTSEFVTVPSDFYCKGLRPEECHPEDLFPAGKLPRPMYYAKSDIAKAPWPSEGIDAVLGWVEDRQRDPVLTPPSFDPHLDAGKVLIEVADAARGVAADATAFPHRDALFISQYASRWRKHASAEVAAAHVASVDVLFEATEPYRSDCSYLGYVHPDLPDRAYHGDNLPRLREIKAKHDPDNFFRHPQSIPPA